MSGITLVNQVKASKFLSGMLQPVANAFVNAAGYRKLGAYLISILSIFGSGGFAIISELSINQDHTSIEDAGRCRLVACGPPQHELSTLCCLARQNLARWSSFKREESVDFGLPYSSQRH